MYPFEISPEYGSNVQSEATACTTSMWLDNTIALPTGFVAFNLATRLTLFGSGVSYTFDSMPSAASRSAISFAVSTVRPTGWELSSFTYAESVCEASSDMASQSTLAASGCGGGAADG